MTLEPMTVKISFLQNVDYINNKSVSSSQNFAAEVTKLGTNDKIRRFDGTVHKKVDH